MVEARGLIHRLKQFCNDRVGGVVTTFAIVAALMVAASGAAIDYTNIARVRADLQNIADTSALAAAREFRLGNAGTTTIVAVAQNFANTALASKSITATVSVAVDGTAKTVTVTLVGSVKTRIMSIVGVAAVSPKVVGVAKVVGGAPICVIGLDSKSNFTVGMELSAKLQAPGCSVYSNSTNSAGLFAKNNATMAAAFICSAGGKSGAGPGSFTPPPQTDCPVIPDPLADRAPPSAIGCIQNNYVVSGGKVTLNPGTYCGGITMNNNAVVTMNAGIYAFKDGPLVVTGGATLTGANVGLYFTGKNATLDLEQFSTVSLTAPKAGSMAGMLVFEDRSVATGQTHQILSDNARMLLGTIYLPRNELHVAANKPVADQSAYTIVVARLFSLSAGPTMILNANYGSTDIPVPDGVGPNANKTLLWQ